MTRTHSLFVFRNKPLYVSIFIVILVGKTYITLYNSFDITEQLPTTDYTWRTLLPNFSFSHIKHIHVYKYKICCKVAAKRETTAPKKYSFQTIVVTVLCSNFFNRIKIFNRGSLNDHSCEVSSICLPSFIIPFCNGYYILRPDMMNCSMVITFKKFSS